MFTMERHGAAARTIEILLVAGASILAGWVIGTVQHFVGFGISDHHMFSRDGFSFAAFEGGVVGGIFGLPTGLIVYYAVLRAAVRPLDVIFTFSAALAGGCLAACLSAVGSVVVTPAVTVLAAMWLSSRRKYRLAAAPR